MRSIDSNEKPMDEEKPDKSQTPEITQVKTNNCWDNWITTQSVMMLSHVHGVGQMTLFGKKTMAVSTVKTAIPTSNVLGVETKKAMHYLPKCDRHQPVITIRRF